MVTLENDFLTVTIDPHGAELTSVLGVHSQIEYLWQADPTVWKRHAPVLFPIVGKLHDDTYQYEGQTYHMGQHGFARDRDFTVVESTKTSATFELTDDAQTRAMFPFAFKLVIHYLLDNNMIRVAYTVTNPATDAPLFFSIGAHPGFNIPLTDETDFDGYYMSFDPKKSRVQIPLDVKAGIDYANRTLAATDVNQSLSHEFFKSDAVIYELNGKTTFRLQSDHSKHGVALTVADAPYLGVWSPYPTTGDFVCIEPWWGIADTIDATGDLTAKLGINELAPQAQFETGYTIQTF